MLKIFLLDVKAVVLVFFSCLALPSGMFSSDSIIYVKGLQRYGFFNYLQIKNRSKHFSNIFFSVHFSFFNFYSYLCTAFREKALGIII